MVVSSTGAPLNKQVLGRLSLRAGTVTGQTRCFRGPPPPPWARGSVAGRAGAAEPGGRAVPRPAAAVAGREPRRPVRRAAGGRRPRPRARGARRAAGLEPAPGGGRLDLPGL